MKLITFIIFLSFSLGIYSSHAGITGTPTPKSAKTTQSSSDKNKSEEDNKLKSNDAH
jgi:hypothetical protein